MATAEPEAPPEPTATELIDSFITDITHQSLVDSDTVVDRLLDIRRKINQEPT